MTRSRFDAQVAAAGPHADDALTTAEAQMAAGAYREALLTVEEALLSLETTACLRSRAESWLAAAPLDLRTAGSADPRRL
jgi:hypothetical protein